MLLSWGRIHGPQGRRRCCNSGDNVEVAAELIKKARIGPLSGRPPLEVSFEGEDRERFRSPPTWLFLIPLQLP